MNCDPFDLAVVNKTLGEAVIEKYLLGRVVHLGASFWRDEKGCAQWTLQEPVVIRNFPCLCREPGCFRTFTAILDTLPDNILKPLRDKPGEDEAERIARERRGQTMKSQLAGHAFTRIIPDEIEDK